MIISDSSEIILSQTLGVAIEDEKRLMKCLEFDLATFYWSTATEAGRRVGALSVEMGFMWTIDSRRKNEKVEAKFWRHHSCSDKLPLTPHHILVISNLISAKKPLQCEIEYLVLCTVSKLRVVVGAKRLGFVIYSVLRMHQFQKYHLLRHGNTLLSTPLPFWTCFITLGQ